MSSSVMPSAKYSWLLSPERFSIASTTRDVMGFDDMYEKFPLERNLKKIDETITVNKPITTIRANAGINEI